MENGASHFRSYDFSLFFPITSWWLFRGKVFFFSFLDDKRMLAVAYKSSRTPANCQRLHRTYSPLQLRRTQASGTLKSINRCTQIFALNWNWRKRADKRGRARRNAKLLCRVQNTGLSKSKTIIPFFTIHDTHHFVSFWKKKNWHFTKKSFKDLLTYLWIIKFL